MYLVRISVNQLSTIRYRQLQWLKELSKAIIQLFLHMDKLAQEKRIPFKVGSKANQKVLYPKLSRTYLESYKKNQLQTKAIKFSFLSYKFTISQFTISLTQTTVDL